MGGLDDKKQGRRAVRPDSAKIAVKSGMRLTGYGGGAQKFWATDIPTGALA